MLRCKHEDGFYNPKNQSYNRFKQGDFQMDFCTNVRDLNPCKSGQMPLYNGTCVNHCSPGYARDDIDFFCKWNGTGNLAGNSSSEAGPKKEIGVMKEMEKDDDNEAKLNEEEKDKSYHLVPLYYVIIGFCSVLILIVVILIKVCCFPNRCVPSCAYLQVPGDLTDSNTSSAQSVEDAVEGMVPLAVKDRVPDAENISLNNISTSKDDDDRSDATVDTDSTSENKVDDETFRKEIIDTQTVVKEKISSESSGLKVKKEKKYHNNLFLKVENVGAFNFGSVSSKEDMHVLMKSLYDELQNCKKPEAAVESFFEKMIDSDKIVSKKDEEGVEEKEELFQDVEILTPDFGGNVTSEVDRVAGEEFASPHCKTLTQLVVTFLSEYMKSVGALIYNGEVIGTVFRAGDDYLITAFHVIRGIIDPRNTGQFNYTLIEAENVFVNFNASVCVTPDCYMYKFHVRHVLSTNTLHLDYTVLQIINRNDALPKGLKLDKRSCSTKTLHGIGYGDPKNPYCKVLDNSCPIISSVSARILDCQTWLHDTNPGLPHQNGANAGPNRVQRFKALVQEMGSDPGIVDKGYKYIDREQHIFLDICLEHRGSGSPFLTSDGFVKGILTSGHPEFFYLLPKLVQAGFPSDKRFECILKLEYVHQNILEQVPVLANKLFG
ncbi:uncharacterized protein LOC132721813 [Ruditapes philippinarum]|uniref:uncharacterized protein LOC132721813 n=1 Tax=Ruditapes philippinarum TaxID=129788 RepID=UPI00295BE848|nr:uncharacterized protein LOC132721813 [Ruditapes philippinarum]